MVHKSTLLYKNVIITPQPSGSWVFPAPWEFGCCPRAVDRDQVGCITVLGHCFHFAEGKGFCSSRRRARGPRRWRGDPEAVRLRDPRASGGIPEREGAEQNHETCRQNTSNVIVVCRGDPDNYLYHQHSV